MPGDVTDIITRAQFYVNRFSGFGVLTHSNVPFSIGLHSWSLLQQCKPGPPCAAHLYPQRSFLSRIPHHLRLSIESIAIGPTAVPFYLIVPLADDFF